MKTKTVFEIRIFPISEVNEAWRAVVSVPREWRNLPGVQGQTSEDGPWLGGEGPSPAQALEELTRKIGRSTLAALHWRAMAPDETGDKS